MKALTPKQALTLLPADASVVSALDCLRFEDLAAPQFWKPGELQRQIEAKEIQLWVVSVGVTPTYILGSHTTTDGGLWIDLAMKCDRARSTLQLDCKTLAEGAELLAKQHGCRYVRFYTRRRALATYAHLYGYQPEAVMLTKGVTA